VQEHVLDAEDAAVAGERDLGVVHLAALLGGGKEVFTSVLDPFDRAAELHRRPRQQHFLWIEQHDLGAETAAHERGDHPHLALAQAEHGGKAAAQEHRRLCGVPHRQLVGAGVPMGDDAAGLDRIGGAAIISEPPADHVGGLRHRRRVIALGLADVGGDIGAEVVMDQR